MLIGICGKSSSGKSTIATELKKYLGEKTIHLDIDKIGHEVLNIKEVEEELKNSFGENIMSNYKVDRKKLGYLVFDSRKEMKKLTDITWKYMQNKIDYILKRNEDKTIILDWILLPHTKYFKNCDLKILIDIPYEVRMKRACKRDNITAEAFALREKASIDYKREDFDECIQDTDEHTIERLVNIL